MEGKLSYKLPSGATVLHANDILITRPTQFLAIECKFLSAVSDQFKSRAFDMLHLKRTLAVRVTGIMVYVHVPGCGIGLSAAKAYCYPFDHFLGFELSGSKALESISFIRVVDIVQSSMVQTHGAAI